MATRSVSRMPKAQGGEQGGAIACTGTRPRVQCAAAERWQTQLLPVAVAQRAVASGAKQRAALSLSGGIAEAASRKTWENIARAALGKHRGMYEYCLAGWVREESMASMGSGAMEWEGIQHQRGGRRALDLFFFVVFFGE